MMTMAEALLNCKYAIGVGLIFRQHFENLILFPSKEKEVVTVRDDDETPVSAVQAAASRHRTSEGTNAPVITFMHL